ncbi:MAG: serine--tRNA ligase [Bdellovibrionales bacterium RIFOXYD12_FULL_39_22]|nr:MAG: serine--tRNA ligase [Bdellovibrionales bacterium RIFOXYB1_FULL_39_21]OFZ41845.1 MAG: serine--tRNA ligase [Bdellovibrionales bacterium RIFOXYC12_FULL_39_17]OFZ50561.1 MAG: serine--tRNA ligase [Bdellovibrionales bacterium RIFOXYC1_FULL_39_130]OFZ75273.1 MAG: serine--tRNA ligase [Bdellovibrionales bacterium RIFOXYC2_FULL_39_8]OFZ77784.1 MAG: serine--tRNA ligase [Bdellovibrionales bacterium RIFOXYD1_FULL_39_84]OFZ93780.1 MAG: serine--tRNA ligase [Bdellovibrionales bacterium RIFOXYD12_FULL_
MHDIRYFEEHTEEAKKNLVRRRPELAMQVDEVLKINHRRKELIRIVESYRAEIKSTSMEIGNLKKAKQDATELMNKVAAIKANVENDEKKLEEILEEQKKLLSMIPNIIDNEVPNGQDDGHNQEIRKWGTPRQFSFTPKDHVDLGQNLKMLDFEKAAEIAGSRFVVYKKHLAKLERALINYMLEKLIAAGYEEIIPPYIVNANTLYGTGQLPKFEDDLFRLEGRPWYLIPTAEVPVTNLKCNELFAGNELPFKYASYTPCFRSEAGSYGKDTKGLIRLHQFNKVEMVQITKAEDSTIAHQAMIDMACSVLEDLKLPYRAVLLCSGDIGFSARKCVDLEVWLPGQNKYREISSISNCWDFQARRAQIRYRGEGGKPEFAHTLNGSCLAVGRTLVAILENYQNADGSITIPEVLRPFMGGMEFIQGTPAKN